MKKLSKLALVLLACFALVATGCKQGPDVDNNGTNTSQSGSSSGTESGGGSESGDGTQTGGDSGEEGGSTGGETGGQTETVAVTEVKITSSVTEVTVDDSITLEVSVSPENASDKTVTWSSNNEDVATVDSNGVVKGVAAGKATITATVGEKKDSVEITVNRKVVVGDIILQDLTIVSSEGYTKNESNPPVAVVAGFNTNGAVIGLGLEKSSGLKWAKENTTGYNTNFTEIAATVTGDNTAGYEFTGNTDGSNNWTEICKADDTASANAQANYPAFYYANNYGTSRGYTDKDKLATGWYIPSISELYEIYKNKETLQTSLTKVSGFTISSANWYWSSSQRSNYSTDAYDLDFRNGTVEASSRYSGLDVLVVRAF